MSNRPRALMIFAAGRGSRMAPLTDHMPKPLVEVAGKPLLRHALDLAPDVDSIVVNTHYLAQQIATFLADQPVTLSYEETLLETGGGLKQALPLLGPGPVLTLNSDAIWETKTVLTDLIAAWDSDRMDALVSVVPPSRARGHKGSGDFDLDDQNRVTRGKGFVYTGAQIIKTDHVASVPEHAFSMNIVWDKMIDQKRLYGRVYDGQWCDVGHPESLPLAEQLCNA